MPTSQGALRTKWEVTSGPIKGLTEIQSTIDKIGKDADAIVLHKGLAKKIDVGNSGLFVHLSGNTGLGSDQNLKIQVCSVEQVLEIIGETFWRIYG